MIKKILSQSIWYTLAAQMPLVANIFLLPLINIHLSTEDYAIFGLVMGYTGLLSGFGDLGSIVLFQNSFFKTPDTYKPEWQKYLNFLNSWRLLYGLVNILLLWLLFKNRIPAENMPYFLFLVGFPIMFFDFTKNIGMRWCQWNEKHKLVYRATIVSGIITLSVSFITIYYFKMGFYGWFISGFITKLFEFIYYYGIIYRQGKLNLSFNIDWAFIKSRLKVALPMIPATYSNYLINNSDRAVLDFYRGINMGVTMSQIGLYNIAYSFANYFSLFNNSVNSVISPMYFKLFAKNDDNAAVMVRNITFLWFYFTLGAGLFLSLWLKEIMSFLYPKPEFATAYSYSILIIMSLVYRPFMVATLDRAIYHEKTKTLLQVTFYGGILNVILNLLVIPFWGIQGAVITSFITYLYIGFSGFYLKEVKKYISKSYRPWLMIGLIVTASCIAFWSKDLGIMHKAGISFLLLISFAIMYLKFGKSLIHSLKSLN